MINYVLIYAFERLTRRLRLDKAPKQLLLAKEYLTISNAEMGECHFLHNFTFDEGSACWKFVQHRVLPPACLPEDIPADVGTAFEVIKRDEWILRGGLRAGISLTLPTLHQIMAAIKCPKPTKGTGKNGRVKKVDIVTALVQYLWPDAGEDFVKDTVGKVMGYATSTEDIDLSVLCMVSELDTDNQESFQRLKTQAARRIDRSLYGKGREAGIRAAKKELGTDKAAACKVDEAAAEKGKKLVENNLEKEKKENIRQWNLTPPELKLLLPGNGDVIGRFWMRWHPKNHWWRVTYPTKSILTAFCPALP